MIFYCSAIVYAVLRIELLFVIKFDVDWTNIRLKDMGRFKRNLSLKNLNLAVLSVVSGICAGIVLQPGGWEHWKVFFLCVIGGSFLMAAITDYASFYVYRFVWWIAGAAGLGLLLQAVLAKAGNITFSLTALLTVLKELHSLHIEELLIFCLLQELFFDKLYGKADCHGFCVGALVICAFGGGMRDFLLYMAVAFGSLAVVQAFKKNINRRGNLKMPVAFMPYIVTALWEIMLVKGLFP